MIFLRLNYSIYFRTRNGDSKLEYLREKKNLKKWSGIQTIVTRRSIIIELGVNGKIVQP